MHVKIYHFSLMFPDFCFSLFISCLRPVYRLLTNPKQLFHPLRWQKKCFIICMLHRRPNHRRPTWREAQLSERAVRRGEAVHHWILLLLPDNRPLLPNHGHMQETLWQSTLVFFGRLASGGDGDDDDPCSFTRCLVKLIGSCFFFVMRHIWYDALCAENKFAIIKSFQIA
jgi:hypothetical protein